MTISVVQVAEFCFCLGIGQILAVDALQPEAVVIRTHWRQIIHCMNLAYATNTNSRLMFMHPDKIHHTPQCVVRGTGADRSRKVCNMSNEFFLIVCCFRMTNCDRRLTGRSLQRLITEINLPIWITNSDRCDHWASANWPKSSVTSYWNQSLWFDGEELPGIAGSTATRPVNEAIQRTLLHFYPLVSVLLT
jgi:hypothetical protein